MQQVHKGFYLHGLINFNGAIVLIVKFGFASLPSKAIAQFWLPLLRQPPMLTEESLLQNELFIDSTAQQHLKETAIWAKFLAVVGFIGSILLATIGIFAGSILEKLTKGLQRKNSGDSYLAGGFIAIIYIFIAAVLFLMCLYLYKFAAKMQLALKDNDQDSLNLSFKHLKIHYRVAGIITIIYMAFLFLAIIGVFIVAFAMH